MKKQYRIELKDKCSNCSETASAYLDSKPFCNECFKMKKKILMNDRMKLFTRQRYERQLKERKELIC